MDKFGFYIILRFCKTVIQSLLAGLLLAMLIICLPIASVIGQTAPETNRHQIERIIEEAVADMDPDESSNEITKLIEFLEDLAQNPININRDDAIRISQVPGLSYQQTIRIIEYRESRKPFETIQELTEVEGIGTKTLQDITPFVSTGTRTERRRDLYFDRRFWTAGGHFEALSRVQSVLEERDGYNRPDSLGGYLGSPIKYNHRFRYRSNHMSLNLSQDKDPGEPLESPFGFDYTSWHVAIRDAGKLENLVVGDFRVSYGQGLTMWNGGSFGKSSQIIGATLKNDPGIRPYTSSQETNALRGVAFSAGEKIQLSGFYSNRKLTASEVDEHRVRSPSQTALHRTRLERDRRLNLEQTTYGGRIRAGVGHSLFGISGYRNQYDRPIAEGTQPYQVHQFSGRTNSVFGLDYRILAGPALLFGEAARSASGGLALISGSELRLPSNTDLAITYRSYAADFQNPFGSSFSEQSAPQNETGIYLGLEQQIRKNVQLNAYIDHFRTKSAKFLNDRPTSGYDWLARLTYEPISELLLYTQYRLKRQEQQTVQKDPYGREFRVMGQNMRSTIRIHAEYQVHPSVRLRSRVDIVKARQPLQPSGFGMLIFQDLRITPSPNLTIDARMTMFDTDDFNSRVFQFENDLLYVMSNAMLFDQGQRTYAVIQYQPSDFIRLRCKASTTLYENRPSIGSGLDEIKGNRRSELGFQVQISI